MSREYAMIAKNSDFCETLLAWRDYGSRQISYNAKYFEDIITIVENLVEKKRFDEACVYASIAAFHAAARHSGIWASSKLEVLLGQIAARAVRPNLSDERTKAVGSIQSVLHVVTQAHSVGGSTKMLERWIKADSSRRHSIALTRQSLMPVPDSVRDAVSGSGGIIHLIDGYVGGLIRHAGVLRTIAQQTDLIVLHINSNDVVPILAFASGRRPPTVFLDHADHSFWLGTSISDIVASMREAGRRILIDHRGVAPDRIMPLPTILDARDRQITRIEAKRRLGLPDECILICSIARSVKYKPIGGASFADIHLPVLNNHREVILLTVGPGERDDWSRAIECAGGRIISLPEQKDTVLYAHAADIYVDSFPFPSTTSALEAGVLGTPCLSIFPYSETSRVLGCSADGLDGVLISCRNLADYHSALTRLISDAAYRLKLGAATRRQILDHHFKQSWLKSLEAVYNRAESAPRHQATALDSDRINRGEPDVFIQSIFGGESDARKDTERLIKFELGVMPIMARMPEWWRLLRAGQLSDNRFGPVVYLMPNWLRWRISRTRKRLLGHALRFTASCRRRIGRA